MAETALENKSRTVAASESSHDTRSVPRLASLPQRSLETLPWARRGWPLKRSDEKKNEKRNGEKTGGDGRE